MTEVSNRWPAVIAHRGASRAERENTVAAYRRAGEMGADAVELDVRRTTDGVLVVHHDPHLGDGRLIAAARAGEPVDWRIKWNPLRFKVGARHQRLDADSV